MLPWSVTARLSMPSFLTCATRSGIRLAPSSSEYSLWVWRWTKRHALTDCGALELAPDGVQRDTASLQQHQKMIEKIGRLGRETLGLLRIRRHDHLDRFLAHLLRDLGHATVEQLHGVRALGPLRRPARDRGGQPGQQVCRPDPHRDVVCAVPRHRGRKTGAGPGVAGRARSARPGRGWCRRRNRAGSRRTVCSWPDVSPLRQSAGAGPAVIVRLAGGERCARGRPGSA